MRTSEIGRRMAAAAALLVACMLAIAPSVMAAKATPKTRVSTGGASHLRTTSAVLTAVINPNGIDTSFHFEYGPTTAYGQQTPLTNVGSGSTKIKVGQAIGGLQAGVTYHFRVVATHPAMPAEAPIDGRDHKFKLKGDALAFHVTKSQRATYGTPFILSGTLTGSGDALQRVSIQASPFPYLEAFSSIGLPAVTNGAGAFSFRIGNLFSSTQFRVSTLALLPLFSPIITVAVAPKVTLHVRSSKQKGLVRLYGTITPAMTNALVEIQVQKAVRPGRKEISERWVTKFITKARKGALDSSRFSLIARVRDGGRYRAFVKPVKSGKLVAGPSTTTTILHAAAQQGK